MEKIRHIFKSQTNQFGIEIWSVTFEYKNKKYLQELMGTELSETKVLCLRSLVSAKHRLLSMLKIYGS